MSNSEKGLDVVENLHRRRRMSKLAKEIMTPAPQCCSAETTT